ncbi:hypothetical protein [Thermococcus sp. 21S9]|uniref:hypothetical protein n=1 Tax=Thermococcus sp. 21S9 TaxID=1638223 RepID=UPI00143C2C33|nr:hypothetical protein [Thermococcus sp. 21S9]NJE55275.1 hypothetical protein [Thermococcus sp. 21S9]
MGFLSFGSKKKKVRTMLESGQFELLVQDAIKDKKVMGAIVELLDDDNPGIVGDALLALTQILETNKDSVSKYLDENNFKKLMNLIHHRNPYIRENAMVLAYDIIKTYPELARKYRSWIVEEIKRGLREGKRDEKGFLLVVIGELGLSELKPLVEELTGVEDKVVLPFEGKKWVPLGQIARETLEKL